MDKNELSKIKQKALIKTLTPVIAIVGLIITITFLSIFLTDVVGLSAGELGSFYVISILMIFVVAILVDNYKNNVNHYIELHEQEKWRSHGK